jgi:hypothetical protein
VYFGCLCVLMILISPVAHAHYYALALPLLTGLHARGQLDRPGQAATSARMIAVMAVWAVLTSVILLPYPIPMRLREAGLGTAATVGLWAFGLVVVARRPRQTAGEVYAGELWAWDGTSLLTARPPGVLPCGLAAPSPR